VYKTQIMRNLLLHVFFLALLLSSCAAQHQLTPQRPPKSDVVGLLSTPTSADATASTAPYEAEPAYLAPPLNFDVNGKSKAQSERKAARILRRWRKRFQHDALQRTKTAPLSDIDVGQSMPRKCKHCTFNQVGGNQTNSTTAKKATSATGEQARATATTTGKHSGPVVAGSDSTSQVNQAGATNAVAHHGNGDSVRQDNSAPQAPKAGAVVADNLSRPLGYVVAGVATIVVVGSVVAVVIARRKRAAAKALLTQATAAVL
jgi:hypothetical protein